MFIFTERFNKTVDNSSVGEEFWAVQSQMLRLQDVSNSELKILQEAVVAKEPYLFTLYQIVEDLNIVLNRPLSMAAAVILAKYHNSKLVDFTVNYKEEILSLYSRSVEFPKMTKPSILQMTNELNSPEFIAYKS